METGRVLGRAVDGVNEEADVENRTERGLDLAAVYDAHAESLYRYLLALVSSEHDAEDALQEVFVALARRPVGSIREMRAYLLKAARHQAFQVLRRRRRHERETVMADVPLTNVDACLPEERAMALDLDRALRALPSEQREVVVLHITEDLTFREIGAVCGIPPNTASSRYRLAVARLRSLLEGGE